ncbi:unnamed protein product [Closterium sp. NIES-54]
MLRSGVAIFDLDYDAILAAMYALSVSAEGYCYLRVPPDPSIEAAALGASESALPSTVLAEALHTFTLESGASRCFFRDTTTLTPLFAPVPVRLADPSRGPILACSSTVLPSCVNLHVYTDGPSSGHVHSSAWVESVHTGYRASSEVAFALVSASGPVAPPFSCRLLTHQTLLWHHRLGHPSLPCLLRMHNRLLVCGLPRSVPSLPPSPAPPCLPCVEGRHRAAPHSSSFPLMVAPLQTLHMDIYEVHLQLQSIFTDLPLLCLHSDRGESSPTLRWTGEVGDASVFRVWGSRAFVCDTYADKLSARAIPCRHAPSGVSQVDPLPGTVPIEVAVASGNESEGAEPGGAEFQGAGSWGAEPGGAEPAGAQPAGVEPRGAESEGAESGGAEPRGSASSEGRADASPQMSLRPEPLSPQGLREWFAQHTCLLSGAAGAGVSAAGDTGAGGAGVTAGAVGTGGAAAASPRGARFRDTGAAATCSVWGAGAGAGGTVQPRPFFVPLLCQVLSLSSSLGLPPRLLSPPPLQSQPQLHPGSPLSAPSPYAEQTNSFIEQREPESRRSSPVCVVHTCRRVPCPRPPPVPGTHAMALRPSFVPLHVPLPPPPDSSLPPVPDPESNLVRAASHSVSRFLATVFTDPSFESTAASPLVAELLDFAAACCLDYATALVAESASASPLSVGGECALSTDVLQDKQEDIERLAAAVPRFTSMRQPTSSAYGPLGSTDSSEGGAKSEWLVDRGVGNGEENWKTKR